MSSFRKRSFQKELLDGDDIPFDDIRRNMQELNFINTWLGGHDITLTGMRSFAHSNKSPIHIVELGCGGGDNLRVIKKWAEHKKISVELTGIDINPECVSFARAENPGINFLCSDYLQADVRADVFFSSLFCHHFTDAEMVTMLRWMTERSTLGFFINDLQRHPVAWFSIRVLTRIFSRSYLVKNDAPLSVKRGFARSDWEKLFQQAGIEKFSCSWKWAFRWLVIYHK